MSRYYDDGDYDENFPNEAELWRANAERALKGKRGRKVLTELREALQNLPEKRLIEGALCTVAPDRRADKAVEENAAALQWSVRALREKVEEQGEGVCAIGAYLWWRKVKAGTDPAEAFDQLPTLQSEDYGLEDTAAIAKREAGVVYSLAWDLAYRNDETFASATPEERWAKFMTWLDAELAEVTS